MAPRTSHDSHAVTVTEVRFENYKALEDFTLTLGRFNVLVGPNNAGKSTIIGAFRVLGAALKRARTRKPSPMTDADGATRPGYLINTTDLGVSLENVHTDLADTVTTILFILSNGNSLRLYFPPKGGECALFCIGAKSPPTGPAQFIADFPLTIGHVPILGPVEYREPLLREETVRSALTTPRAARHFRNFWYHNPEGFDDFAALLATSWPGMEIERPEVQVGTETTIAMFCRESRMTRELYWAGFGFQVWCQLLTHIRRAQRDTILIVDEPEVYLHPDLQRQLVHVLRSTGADVVLATHSAAVLNDVDPADILIIDKQRLSAQHIRPSADTRFAATILGTDYKNQLASLARSRRLLFLEAQDDAELLSQFARRIGLVELANGSGLTIVQMAAFPDWAAVHSTVDVLQNVIGQRLEIGVLVTSRHRSTHEAEALRNEGLARLTMFQSLPQFTLSNYLLDPVVLGCAIRAVRKDMGRRGRITAEADRIDIHTLLRDVGEILRRDVERSYLAHRHRSDTATSSSSLGGGEQELTECWSDDGQRLSLLPGNLAFGLVQSTLFSNHGLVLSERDVVEAMPLERFPSELQDVLRAIDAFRR